MKNIALPIPLFLIIALLILNSCSAPEQNQNVKLDVMTYNIKYDAKNDPHFNWDARKTDVFDLLNRYQPGIFGTQEGLFHQLNDMEGALDGYTWYGRSRNGVPDEGEFSSIFYDSTKYELLAGDTFWLSETPSQPGKGWDAAYPRICTWAKFDLRMESGRQEFYVFNTHFDHVGVEARRNSARQIIDSVLSITDRAPAILMGDFNTIDTTRTYQVLASGDLRDSFRISKKPPSGPGGTFSGFRVTEEPVERRIDYIFVDEHFTVQHHSHIGDNNDGAYPSDHLPVLSELKWEL